MKRFFLNFKKGFSLLETLVAIFLLIMVIIGPFSMAVKSLVLISLSQHQITASYLGQEGIEIIRSVRDNNFINNRDWLFGLDPCLGNDGCYVDALTGLAYQCLGACPYIKYNASSTIPYNYQNGNDTIFTRKIKITKLSNSDEAKVEVVVSWPERYIGTKTFTIQENIFNWKP